jgi:hypothetical protein
LVAVKAATRLKNISSVNFSEKHLTLGWFRNVATGRAGPGATERAGIMTNVIDASAQFAPSQPSLRPSAFVQQFRLDNILADETPVRPPPRRQLARPPHISWGQLVRVLLLLLIGAAIVDGPALTKEGAAGAILSALRDRV